MDRYVNRNELIVSVQYISQYQIISYQKVKYSLIPSAINHAKNEANIGAAAIGLKII